MPYIPSKESQAHRVAPGATARQRLAYGIWKTASGDEVLFDRRYRPLLRRTRDGRVTPEDPCCWVESIVEERWLYDDGVDLPARKRIVAAVLAEWGIPRKAPSARELERLGTRAENRGCDACAARFAQWQPYFIARTKRNTWSVRCDACVAGCAEVAIVGACGGPAADPWTEDDRVWFAAHPRRHWRLRLPIRGELKAAAFDRQAAVPPPPFGMSTAIAVCQVEPGKRIRHIVAITTDDPLDSYTDVGICRLIPGLHAQMTDRVAAIGDRWDERYGEKITRRINRLTSVVQS